MNEHQSDLFRGYQANTFGRSHLLLPAHVAEAWAQDKEAARKAAELRASIEQGTFFDKKKGDAEPADPEDSADESEAPPEPKVGRRNLVPVFDPERLALARKRAKGVRRDSEHRLETVLETAARWNGHRQVMRRRRGRGFGEILADLAHRFPNFRGLLDTLAPDLALQFAMPAASFRLAPLLLYGAPGIGKTRFAEALAQALGVGFSKVSAGGAQGAFEISGTSKHWSTSAPGRVFLLLAEGDYATPVLLIDEVDKISGDSQQPVLPALLDLVEEHSARNYRDVSVDLEFDASRIIVIATANDIESVPSPLRSRMREVEVLMPTVEERLAIAQHMLGALLERMHARHRPEVEHGVLERLAQAPIDLRELTRQLRRALGQAVMARRKQVRAEDLQLPQGGHSDQRIGFI